VGDDSRRLFFFGLFFSFGHSLPLEDEILIVRKSKVLLASTLYP